MDSENSAGSIPKLAAALILMIMAEATGAKLFCDKQAGAWPMGQPYASSTNSGPRHLHEPGPVDVHGDNGLPGPQIWPLKWYG